MLHLTSKLFWTGLYLKTQLLHELPTSWNHWVTNLISLIMKCQVLCFFVKSYWGEMVSFSINGLLTQSYLWTKSKIQFRKTRGYARRRYSDWPEQSWRQNFILGRLRSMNVLMKSIHVAMKIAALLTALTKAKQISFYHKHILTFPILRECEHRLYNYHLRYICRAIQKIVQTEA